jgi:predicted lipoprotein with Yx(FWY)xxD motif
MSSPATPGQQISTERPEEQKVTSPVLAPNDTSRAGRPPSGWRIAVLVLLATTALALTACSGGSTAANGTTTTTGPGRVVVTTASRGSVGTILVAPSGHTLYHLTTDKNDHSTCNGSCAQLWPPLTVPAGTRPEAVAGLTGTLGTFTRADGSTQVTYDSEPLYTYAPDTTSSDVLGQGVGGVWFVVTAAGSGAPATSTTTASGGYGY